MSIVSSVVDAMPSFALSVAGIDLVIDVSSPDGEGRWADDSAEGEVASLTIFDLTFAIYRYAARQSITCVSNLMAIHYGTVASLLFSSFIFSLFVFRFTFVKPFHNKKIEEPLAETFGR